MILPNTAHGVGYSDSFARRRRDFFVRHLPGIAPPPFKFGPREQG